MGVWPVSGLRGGGAWAGETSEATTAVGQVDGFENHLPYRTTRFEARCGLGLIWIPVT